MNPTCPLTIGMLIDVSGSMEALIPIERTAGSEFFQQVLRKQDLAFLISFGKDSELMQDSTGSPRQLERGLNDLKPNVAISFGGGPVPTANNQAGTVLYDAVFLAADERLRRETGRKVIILITDGEDTGSRKSRDQAIEAAQKSDAIIYSIFYSDPRYGGGNEGVLKRMSEETGGRVFRVSGRGNLDSIFKEIQEEMRTQYSDHLLAHQFHKGRWISQAGIPAGEQGLQGPGPQRLLRNRTGAVKNRSNKVVIKRLAWLSVLLLGAGCGRNFPAAP